MTSSTDAFVFLCVSGRSRPQVERMSIFAPRRHRVQQIKPGPTATWWISGPDSKHDTLGQKLNFMALLCIHVQENECLLCVADSKNNLVLPNVTCIGKENTIHHGGIFVKNDSRLQNGKKSPSSFLSWSAKLFCSLSPLPKKKCNRSRLCVKQVAFWAKEQFSQCCPDQSRSICWGGSLELFDSPMTCARTDDARDSAHSPGTICSLRERHQHKLPLLYLCSHESDIHNRGN